MRVLHVVAETPLSFLQHLKDITYIERRPLRYLLPSVDQREFKCQLPGFVLKDCNRLYGHWNSVG